MNRIEEICSVLKKGKILADVGCDHGYIADLALKKGLFEKVYLSDISAGSLKKAEALLSEEIKKGRCIPVVADGMKGLPLNVDTLLIAGLGGEEIIKILREGYLPKQFVFQPMKNAEKLREYLLECGAKIERDDTFSCGGYYYDLIAGENSGGSSYSALEIKFGRDNLTCRGEAFLGKLHEECKKLEGYLREESMSEQNRRKLGDQLKQLREILDETH